MRRFRPGIARRRALGLGLGLLVSLVACGVGAEAAPATTDRIELPATALGGGPARATALVRDEAGIRYELTGADGAIVRLDPAAYAAALLEGTRPRSSLERLLRVDGPVGLAWVAFGLAGQALFAGRMVVQWLVSERRKRSVVPPIFWWLSLVGSTMLLTYFLWRADIVGILGQSLGLFIYVRNLVLLRRAAREAGSAGEAAWT